MTRAETALRLLGLAGALAVTACRDRSAPPKPPQPTPQVPTAAGIAEGPEPVAARLEYHVHTLAIEIGGRDTNHPAALESAARHIETTWQAQGYEVDTQEYGVGSARVRNLEVELPGRDLADEIVLVGAHYDTAFGNPGANDNGSGVAAMLELSGSFAGHRGQRTLRFVAFVNEEPPYFQTDSMGSLVYARRSKERGEDIVGMFSLETMGFYTDAPDSQHYPAIIAPFYPDRGNFVAFVGNGRSRRFVKKVVRSFREHTIFPVESIAATDLIPGIGWSDHWSFYEQGYPAVMVTDTAPNRYAHYHEPTDTPDKLDYVATARVVAGLRGVVAAQIAGPADSSDP